MRGKALYNAGLLAIPQAEEYLYFDILTGDKRQESELRFNFPTAQNWHEIHGKDVNELINEAKKNYWNERSTSLLQEVLNGLDDNLEDQILKHVEESIESNKADYSEIFDRLLVAPLRNDVDVQYYAEKALSNGLANVGAILDQLREIQPYVKRFTHNWLKINEDRFNEFSTSKQELWKEIIRITDFSKLLQFEDREEFIKKWGALIFHYKAPNDRIVLQKLGSQLADKIYPHQTEIEKNIEDLVDRKREESEYKEHSNLSNIEAYRSVNKQIDAILKEVEGGNDKLAKKFLRELVDMQLKFPDGKSHVVKSLCNIAQKSANIFRYDFENYCLKKALDLSSKDQWTMIQYGDHLKRIEKYDEALSILKEANKIKNNTIGKSLIADIYTQRGDFLKAQDLYKEIENWNQIPSVLTAIADVNRKMGLLSDAKNIYSKLLEHAEKGHEEYLGDTFYRAKVGIAEIAKQEGNIKRSKELYEEILTSNIEDNNSRVFYQLGYADVLKISERYKDAYEIVDNIIQEYPFATEAKIKRGSILGIISREQEGLKDLSSDTSNYWKNWLRNYYKGLILFKLERFQDAKKNLVDTFPKAINSENEESILRLGAALWFIGNEEHSKATDFLSKLPNLNNYQTKYLTLVLKLHIATKDKKDELIKSIKDQIKESEIVDEKLKKAIDALNNQDFKLALKYEADALLKLAA